MYILDFVHFIEDHALVIENIVKAFYLDRLEFSKQPFHTVFASVTVIFVVDDDVCTLY